jgi:hypothetical protein
MTSTHLGTKPVWKYLFDATNIKNFKLEKNVVLLPISPLFDLRVDFKILVASVLVVKAMGFKEIAILTPKKGRCY